jgi:hypothetical protein
VYGDDEEDEWDIKRALERQGDAQIKVEIQSNSEFQSLTQVQLRVHDHLGFKLMYRMHMKSDLDILHWNEKGTR